MYIYLLYHISSSEFILGMNRAHKFVNVSRFKGNQLSTLTINSWPINKHIHVDGRLNSTQKFERHPKLQTTCISKENMTICHELCLLCKVSQRSIIEKSNTDLRNYFWVQWATLTIMTFVLMSECTKYCGSCVTIKDLHV